MGSILIYTVIFFAGYYGAYVINLMTVRPLITNRYIAGLIPVFLFAIAHGYKIVNSPMPQGQNTSIEYALSFNVVMPVVIIVMGAIYAMWNKKDDKDRMDDKDNSNDIDNDPADKDSSNDIDNSADKDKSDNKDP